MSNEDKLTQLFTRLEALIDANQQALQQTQTEKLTLLHENLELQRQIAQLAQRTSQPAQRQPAASKAVTQTAFAFDEPEETESQASDIFVPAAAETPVQPPAVAETPLDALSPEARLAHWFRQYPAAFIARGEPLPLQVGIHDVLHQQEQGNPKKIRRALAGYVKLPRYLRCLKAGAQRVDLQGRPAGLVTQEEMDFAQAQLQAWEARHKHKAKPRPAPRKKQVDRQAQQLEARLQHKLNELLQRHRGR